MPNNLPIPPYESIHQASSVSQSLVAVSKSGQTESYASEFDSDGYRKHNPTMNLDCHHSYQDRESSISNHWNSYVLLFRTTIFSSRVDSETVRGFIEHMRTLHKHDVVNNSFETRSVQLWQVGGAMDSEKKAIFELLDHLTTREGVKLLCALLNVPCVDMIGALHSVFNLLSRNPKA